MTNRTNRSDNQADSVAIRQAKTDAMPGQSESQNSESQNSESQKPQSILDELNQIEQEEMENEIGLEEVAVDSEDLNVIAADDADDEEELEKDLEDGVGDRINAGETVSDLPQELTQSYATGLQGQPIDRSGRRDYLNPDQYLNEATPALTGGDVDANYEQANAVGDESVGGTVATPDQDIVDDLGTAVGLNVDDRAFLRTNDTMAERDDRRWELDPKSSEDYQERRD